MQRIHLAWFAMGLLAMSHACSSSDDVPKPAGGAAGGGAGGSAGDASAAGGTGDAGQGTLTDGGGEQGGAGTTGEGGAAQVGGAPTSGTAGAGGAALGEGGAGGSAPEPPDLVTSSGGPWPDSFSAYCASSSSLIACPQTDAPFFGQDGSYRINVPTYTTTATTLSDAITGLMWQISPQTTGKNHAASLGYCDALVLGGHSDWRLPSRLEFVSILDYGFDNGCAMPPGIPVGTTGQYWTSSTTGTTPDSFFVMDDSKGLWNVASDSAQPAARCVRGAALTGALQVGTDTTIDDLSGLEWQTSSLDDSNRDWQAALAYCEALMHSSKGDWRLPSIKELATIVDEAGAESQVVNSVSFGSSTAARYWSSTPAESFGSERYVLTLETTFGTSPSQKTTDPAAAARCVRSAD